jgi:hypothetical protein
VFESKSMFCLGCKQRRVLEQLTFCYQCRRKIAGWLRQGKTPEQIGGKREEVVAAVQRLGPRIRQEWSRK